MASASVFASGVDHCRLVVAGVEVEDQREAQVVSDNAIGRVCNRLHRIAVRNRFRGLALMSVFYRSSMTSVCSEPQKFGFQNAKVKEL
jgi:hypothetical protein